MAHREMDRQEGVRVPCVVGASVYHGGEPDGKRYDCAFCRCREGSVAHFTVEPHTLRSAALRCLDDMEKLGSSQEVVDLEFRIDADRFFVGIGMSTTTKRSDVGYDVPTRNRLKLCCFLLGYARFMADNCCAPSCQFVFSPLQLTQELRERTHAGVFYCWDCRALITGLRVVGVPVCRSFLFGDANEEMEKAVACLASSIRSTM